MNNCCERLDDYLDGDMTAEQQATWRTIAQDCPDCQEVLRQQEEIDRSLVAAWSQIEPPVEVAGETSPAESGKGERRWIGVLVLAASVLIVAVVLSRWFVPSEEPGPQDHEVVSIEKTAPAIDPPAAEVTSPATVVTSATSLVVPIASEPNYTIVQVIPEFKRSATPDRKP